MKIISKYKDYYDYLSGIYGEDNNIILDRRNFYSRKHIPNENTIVKLYLCDLRYVGIVKNKSYHWGQNILNVLSKEELETYNPKDNSVSINNGYRKYNWNKIILNPIETNINIINDCPILLSSIIFSKNFDKFPILKDINIPSIISPQEIYLKLVEWLVPKDNFEDNRTDKEKIISSGFDIKESFRNIK